MRPQGGEQMTQCHKCKADTLKEGTYTLRRTVAGREFERVVPALVCPACGEALFSSVDLGAFEDQIGRALVAAGVQTPDAVRWVLDAHSLGPELLGATWRDVKAWEQGTAPMPPDVWPALLAAVAQAGGTASQATGTGGE